MRKWEKQQEDQEHEEQVALAGPFARSKVIELNGMHMGAEQIEETILDALCAPAGKRLEELLAGKSAGLNNMTIVILDELDQLIMSKQTAILYRLFEITSAPNSSLVFVGVANALRLRDSLPLLHTSKYGGKVEQITFESYTAVQLEEILKGRQAHSVFDAGALRLCVTQAAKSSGDARKALHFAKLAVEHALKDLASTWGNQPKRKLPRVSAQHMLHAMGSLGSKRIEQIRALPLYQKVVLCSLATAKGQPGASAMTGAQLPWQQVYDVYKAVCARVSLAAVTPSDFCDLCTALEGCALISTKAKANRLHTLLLQVSESELRVAISDTKMLQRAFP